MIVAAGVATQPQEAVREDAATQKTFEFVRDKVRQLRAGFRVKLLAERLKMLAHQPV
jgi:hypothetical protein